jgi:hypothetical protein
MPPRQPASMSSMTANEHSHGFVADARMVPTPRGLAASGSGIAAARASAEDALEATGVDPVDGE